MSPPHSQIACTRPTLRDAGSQCGPGNCSGSRQDQTGTTKLPDGLERTKGATACPSPFTSSSAHPGDVTQDTRSAQRGTSGATTGGGGRSAADPDYDAAELLIGGGRSAPDPDYDAAELLIGGGRSAPDA